MSIPDSFRSKNCIYLFSRHTRQLEQILLLFTLINVQLTKTAQNLEKKCMKSLKIGKISEFLSFSVSIWINFIREIAIISSDKTTRPPTHSYLTPQNTPILEDCWNVNKKCINLWKLESFGIFVTFVVGLRHFHSEHRNCLFIKGYWTINFFLVDPSKHSNPRRPSKL